LKTKLNKKINELKISFNKERNKNIELYLQDPSPSADSDYSLWKATKRLEQPQSTSRALNTKKRQLVDKKEQEKAPLPPTLTKYLSLNPRETNTKDEDECSFVQQGIACNGYNKMTQAQAVRPEKLTT